MTHSLVPRAPCTAQEPLRLAVLISGSGTNLQAILDAAKSPGALFRVDVVVSNRPMAKGLERAEAAGVPELTVDHRQFDGREGFETELLAKLAPFDVDVVVLAGFMRVLTDKFLGGYPNRVINVHPALLPAFPGMRASQQSLDAGSRIAGCTVHLVDSGVDTGAVLAQAAVPVHHDDNIEQLQARIQTQEHRLLPRILRAFADGSVVIDDDDRIVVRGLRPTADSLSFD